MNSHFKVVLCLTFLWNIVYGRRCLECTRMTQPLDCVTITECGAHEICYLDHYITNDGITLYDVGCKDRRICSISTPLGKRSLNVSGVLSDATTVCSECCDSRDICNMQGTVCTSEVPKLPPGSKLCYDCPLAPSPDDCNQMSLCDQDSACSMSMQRNLIGDHRWKHSCAPKAQCASIAASSSLSCSYCCTDDLCNRNCTLPSSLVAAATTISTTTTTTTTIKPLSAPIVTNVIMRPNSITYGDTVTVSCIATGNPAPTFDFLYKGASLAPNVKVTQGSNVLTITNYAQVNDGDYRCVATNRLGDSHRDMHLQGH